MNQADTAWMLMSTALVLLMTPALAFFYGGLVRSKNALNTMMMSFISLGFVGVLWALVGYTLALSPGSNFLGDLSFLFLKGVDLSEKGANLRCRLALAEVAARAGGTEQWPGARVRAAPDNQYARDRIVRAQQRTHRFHQVRIDDEHVRCHPLEQIEECLRFLGEADDLDAVERSGELGKSAQPQRVG
jgi:hypothetical protein